MTRHKFILGMLFVVTFALSSAPLVQAQTDLPEEPEEEEVNNPSAWTFGVKGGLNAGWLRSDSTTIGNHMGSVAGLFAGLQKGILGGQVELLYSSKGYKTGDRSVTLDYLEMPILVSLKLPHLGPVRPVLSTGPSGAFRLRTVYGTAKTSTQDAFKADVNRFEVGWVAAVALEMSLPRGGLTIEGRYNLGLTPVFVDGSSYASGNDKNRGFVGLVGYRF